jgi:hypothetical protein
MATAVIERGTPLEARMQRLFMCQGAFAERGLLVRATKGDSRLVTDIDVVAHDYSINFHHRRIYAECKGGKSRTPLDRSVWIRGIKEAISADFAYLVLDRCDPSTAQYAKSIGVEILQHSSLTTLETALKIGRDFWPGRSNLHAYARFDDAFKRTVGRNTRSGLPDWLYQASEIWRDASALSFSYGRLNTLLGALERCGELVLDSGSADDELVVTYAVAALLVRLCQYVLFCASDTLAMTHTAREGYIAERFTAGTFDLDQVRGLLESVTKMVRAQLKAQGQSPPESWKVDHLLAAPSYSRPFTEVIDRCVAEGDKLRLLPLAMELRLFGYSGDERDSGRLINRIRPGLDLTGLVIAFARQSLGLPESFVRGPLHFVPKTAVTAITPRNDGDREVSQLGVQSPPHDATGPAASGQETPQSGTSGEGATDDFGPGAPSPPGGA